MKFNFALVCSFFLCVLISCSTEQPSALLAEKQQQIARIDSLQKRMVEERNRGLDKELALQAIAAYQKYVKMFPDDSLSAEYLFRVSDISRGIGDYSTALNSLQTITNSYPGFNKMPECFFLQGYYCQEFFHDSVSAKMHYREFISKYPQHPLVNDAKTLMRLFGKSDEQIVKQFSDK